jgi:hypothetical protein
MGAATAFYAFSPDPQWGGLGPEAGMVKGSDGAFYGTTIKAAQRSRAVAWVLAQSFDSCIPTCPMISAFSQLCQRCERCYLLVALPRASFLSPPTNLRAPDWQAVIGAPTQNNGHRRSFSRWRNSALFPFAQAVNKSAAAFSISLRLICLWLRDARRWIVRGVNP